MKTAEREIYNSELFLGYLLNKICDTDDMTLCTVRYFWETRCSLDHLLENTIIRFDTNLWSSCISNAAVIKEKWDATENILKHFKAILKNLKCIYFCIKCIKYNNNINYYIYIAWFIEQFSLQYQTAGKLLKGVLVNTCTGFKTSAPIENNGMKANRTSEELKNRMDDLLWHLP